MASDLSYLQDVTVNINLDRTINLGNYENVKPSIGISAKIPEGKKVEEAIDEIYDYVYNFLCDETDAIKDGENK